MRLPKIWDFLEFNDEENSKGGYIKGIRADAPDETKAAYHDFLLDEALFKYADVFGENFPIMNFSGLNSSAIIEQINFYLNVGLPYKTNAPKVIITKAILPSRMKKAMVDQNITQADLSTMTGIGRSGISQYISGKNIPKAKTITLIADALNVSEDWLSGKVEEFDENNNLINLSIATAAKLMGVSKQCIRLGLQRKQLPFGWAIKTSSKYTYYISPKKFTEYTGIEIK